MSGYRPANRGNRTPSTVRHGQRVSRKLIAMGWKISPAARKHRYDGVFVSAAGDFVSVMVDLGLRDRNARTAEAIAAQVRGSGWGPSAEAKQLGDTDVYLVTFKHLI